jgi:hypothetical protein
MWVLAITLVSIIVIEILIVVLILRRKKILLKESEASSVVLSSTTLLSSVVTSLPPPEPTWNLYDVTPQLPLGSTNRITNFAWNDEAGAKSDRHLFTDGNDMHLLINGFTNSWYISKNTDHSETYYFKSTENPYYYLGPELPIPLDTSSQVNSGTSTKIRSFTVTKVDPILHPDRYYIDTLHNGQSLRLCVLSTLNNLVYFKPITSNDIYDFRCQWNISK